MPERKDVKTSPNEGTAAVKIASGAELATRKGDIVDQIVADAEVRAASAVASKTLAGLRGRQATAGYFLKRQRLAKDLQS